MSPQAKWEYMKRVHARYLKAKTRLEKGRILDEFCRTYNCHRKHALRLLNAPTPADERPRRPRRGSVYDRGRLPGILEAVWDGSAPGGRHAPGLYFPGMLALALASLLGGAALALEPELEAPYSASPSCRPIWKDPPVRVPTVRRGGELEERLTRSLRGPIVKGARALHLLDQAAQKAGCPPYPAPSVYAAYDVLRSTLQAALESDARAFAETNLSFSVRWEERRLSGLEAELGGPDPAPGPLAGTCRPPRVSTEVFVAEPGQAASEEERRALAEVERRARALRDGAAGLLAAYTAALDALEGRACTESNRLFLRVASEQRQAFFLQRDLALGRAARSRLRWTPLSD